jgi:hypothetical protein
MVAALRAGRLQRHLRLPRLQGRTARSAASPAARRNGLQHITQLGTGNYNEKTARLYTDFSFITADENIGRDAARFFRNMQLENVSTEYEKHAGGAPADQAAPARLLDEQIEQGEGGKPCGVFLKTNSVTDKDIIEKIVEAARRASTWTCWSAASAASCPASKGYTDNVRVVSIVGRLLEHSRIYIFGPDNGQQHLPVQRRPDDAQHGQARRDRLAGAAPRATTSIRAAPVKVDLTTRRWDTSPRRAPDSLFPTPPSCRELAASPRRRIRTTASPWPQGRRTDRRSDRRAARR